MRAARVDGKLSVAGAIAQLLAEMWARLCFGVLGTANFKITYALCGAGACSTSRRDMREMRQAWEMPMRVFRTSSFLSAFILVRG